jgi:hypothetical protein
MGVFKGPPSSSAPVNVGATNTAVMYAPGKILQLGGNGAFNADALPGSNMATVIDINGGNPVLTEQPRMTYPRRYPNSIVLADGKVVVTGGATFGNDYAGEPADPVFAVEIWNPVNGTWSVGANAARFRGYHSFTILLANGAILSTGGGTPGPVTNLNAEIYYPPYLFRTVGSAAQLAPRPVIRAISGLTYSNGAPMQMDMTTEEAISGLVLLCTSNGTHSFNTSSTHPQNGRRAARTTGGSPLRLRRLSRKRGRAPPAQWQAKTRPTIRQAQQY